MTYAGRHTVSVISVLALILCVACRNEKITLTYIANCGFIIESADNKIIVDGLFRFGHNRYQTPDTGVIRMITSGGEPFQGIDLILVTHTHVDHFDRRLVTACMENNPGAALICPSQAVDSLRVDSLSFLKIKDRIIQCNPDPDTSQCIRHGELEIHACRFQHTGGERFADTEHLAFLISGKGGTVFHSGDIDPYKTGDYSGIRIYEHNPDIGLLNEDYSKPENAGLAAEFINARNNVAMHLPESQNAVWADTVRKNPHLFRNPFIFTRSLEKKSF